jgi:hypothetical protein
MTTGTYARPRQDQPTTAGGVILVTVSILAMLLVAAGLFYAAGTGGRHKAALAAAGCEPNLSPSGLPCTTVQVLARRYTAIATPAVQQLTADTAAYVATERHDLAAAKAALRAEMTSANALDASLTRFPFPPMAAPIAGALVRANRARGELIAEQARSASLSQLRSYNRRVKAANAAVRADLSRLGKALATRPAVSQEP